MNLKYKIIITIAARLIETARFLYICSGCKVYKDYGDKLCGNEIPVGTFGKNKSVNRYRGVD